MSLLKLKKKYENNFNKKSSHNINNDLEENKSEENIYNKYLNNNSLIVGEEVNISGIIKTNNEIIVNEIIDADIDCKTIIVNNNGNLKGKIRAENITIAGEVDGEIIFKDQNIEHADLTDWKSLLWSY